MPIELRFPVKSRSSKVEFMSPCWNFVINQELQSINWVAWSSLCFDGKYYFHFVIVLSLAIRVFGFQFHSHILQIRVDDTIVFTINSFASYGCRMAWFGPHHFSLDTCPDFLFVRWSYICVYRGSHPAFGRIQYSFSLCIARQVLLYTGRDFR
jgi:hypothetical protein